MPKYDYACLAEGYKVEEDSKVTNLNLNKLVYGSTGAGKTFSMVYPTLANTENSSVVLTLSKRADCTKIEKHFKKKGYKTYVLDLANLKGNTIGYNPLDYVNNEQDSKKLARGILDIDNYKSVDNFWPDSAVAAVNSIIQLELLNAEYSERKPDFQNVIKLLKDFRVFSVNGSASTSLAPIFDEIKQRRPGNHASKSWTAIEGAPEKTLSCIYSTIVTAVDVFFDENLKYLFSNKKCIDFNKLGQEKSALFVITSPVNSSLNRIVNMIYSDLFRVLFEQAEASKTGSLKVPVHVYCDDFACGKIPDFDKFIAISRAAKISATMLLQNEAQLTALYGPEGANTIKGCSDTLIYFSSQDIQTVTDLAQRLNKPVNRVLEMPAEYVAVFRRGKPHVVARRYQTLEDPRFKEMMGGEI